MSFAKHGMAGRSPCRRFGGRKALLVALTLACAPAAHAADLLGTVFSDDNRNGVLEAAETRIEGVVLNLFSLGLPCPFLPGFDPYGQSRLGSSEFDAAGGGSLVCNLSRRAGGMESPAQDFLWYWEYVRVQDTSTTPVPCSDPDGPTNRKRLQVWTVSRSSDTGQEFLASQVFDQTYSTSLAQQQLVPASSDVPKVLVPTLDPANPETFQTKVLYRELQWNCQIDEWRHPDDPTNPIDPADFSFSAFPTVGCNVGGPVFKNPLCNIGRFDTGPAGDYTFSDIEPGEYRVALDPANFAPGGALEGLVVTTGNAGEGTVLDVADPAGVFIVDFGVTDASAVPVGSRPTWIVLTLLMVGTAALVMHRRFAGA